MKLFTNKNFIQKIIIAIVIVLLFNFIVPKISMAADGGVLWEPIQRLVLNLGDAAISGIQKFMYDFDYTIVTVQEGSAVWSYVAGGLAGLATAAGLIALQFIPVVGQFLTVGILAAIGTGAVVGYAVQTNSLPETMDLPIFLISPQEIFANQVPMLDVDFINADTDTTVRDADGNPVTDADGNQIQQQSISSQLRSTIAKWYVSLRNLAIVGLLSILIYIGIRIMITSIASDKAKYKQMLMDWLVALCLLFVLHYIMSFAITITEVIIDGVGSINKTVTIEFPDLKEKYSKILGSEEKEEYTSSLIETNTQDGITYWPTNLMGKARIDLQLLGEDGDESNNLLIQMAYTIMYIGMVIYTIMFLIIYIKRVIYMAFLTLVAPLVALTYPIDKINDGKAQAFNIWLKEYIYNLLIQPFHLVIYTILIGSAIDLALNNPVYALVAFGFVLQAEKLLRKFFGFDKASTVGAGSTALGGALAMQAVNQIRKLGKGSGKSNGKAAGKGSGGSGNSNNRVRTADRGRSTDQLINDINEQNERTPQLNGRTDENYQNEENSGEGVTNNERQQEPIFVDFQNRRVRTPQEVQNTRTSSLGDTPNNTVSVGEQNKGRRSWGRYFEDPEDDTRGILAATRDVLAATPPGRGVRKLGRKISDGALTARDLGSRVVKKVVPKPLRNSIRGATTVAAKGAGWALNKGIRVAGRGLGAAAGATIGVAAGLVSDDFSKIATYGAAGAGAGYVAAGGIGAGTSNFAENIRDTYREGRSNGNDKEITNEQLDRAALKDKNRRTLYQKELGVSAVEARRAVEESQKYREQGITDDKIIIKAMKSEGFGDARNSNERILLASLAKSIDGDYKKLENAEKRLERNKWSKAEVKRYSDRLRKMMDM